MPAKAHDVIGCHNKEVTVRVGSGGIVAKVENQTLVNSETHKHTQSSVLMASEKGREHAVSQAKHSTSNTPQSQAAIVSGAIHLPAGTTTFSLARSSVSPNGSTSRSVEPISIKGDTTAIQVSGAYSITRQADNSFIITAAPQFRGTLTITTPDKKSLSLSTTQGASEKGVANTSQTETTSSITKNLRTANLPESIIESTYSTPNKLATDLRATFERYQPTIGKDALSGSDNSTWRSYNSEYQQLVKTYEKYLTNGGRNLPSDSESLKAVAKVNKDLNDLFDRYSQQGLTFSKQSTPSPLAEQSSKTAIDPSPEKSWQAKASELFKKVTDLNKSVAEDAKVHAEKPTAETKSKQDRNSAYLEKHGLFAKLYEDKELRKDPALMSSLLKHWEVMVRNFESERAKPLASNSLSSFALSFNQVITTAASNPAAIGLRYHKDMTETAVRSQLLAEVKLSPTRTPTATEMVDLLKLEKLLTKIGGPRLEGEQSSALNSADHEAIIQSLVREKFSQPHKLASEAIKSAGVSPDSETAIGIRYALLGYESLPADIKRKLEFGERVSQKPFQGPLRKFISGEYQKGVTKLEQGKNQAITEITNEIRKQAKEGLETITKSTGALNANRVDPTPRNVTEAEIRELSQLAEKLASIGSPDGTPGKSSYLQSVEKVTGAKIETFVPTGLNVGLVRHFISAATQFTPPTGLPEGVAFEVTKSVKGE